jgi:hypothetical protein
MLKLCLSVLSVQNNHELELTASSLDDVIAMYMLQCLFGRQRRLNCSVERVIAFKRIVYWTKFVYMSLFVSPHCETEGFWGSAQN